MGKHDHAIALALPPMESMWAQATKSAAERAARPASKRVANGADIVARANTEDASRVAREAAPSSLAEVIPLFERQDDGRHTARTDVALFCWVNLPTESKRAYVINLSTEGARLDGIAPLPVGTRFLLKVRFAPQTTPVSSFAQVVRIDDEGCTCVHFIAPEWGFFSATDERLGPFIGGRR